MDTLPWYITEKGESSGKAIDDHAPMERFWGSLNNEGAHHQRYASRDQTIASIRAIIEIFYNRQRRHARLGNLAPAVFA